MPYSLDNRLVVGIASSALFDLAAADDVFRNHGEQAYRKYQEDKLTEPLGPGVAFPFIKRLLSLNDLSGGDGPLVEVVILSRNDPDTGLRVMRSVEHHNLAITRAIFMQGKSPYKFMPVLHMALFLSANRADVHEATSRGLPAGLVLPSDYVDDTDDADLRIAFDFDGVLADDASERVMQAGGLEEFHAHERANTVTPHSPGPLAGFLREINRIQRREEDRRLEDPTYRIRLHVAIVTARSAPSHERPISSLKAWGVTVNDVFFLGGVDKGPVIGVLRPHIFFDDQQANLTSTSPMAPSVHIPYGVVNLPSGAGEAAGGEPAPHAEHAGGRTDDQ
ncbi:5'-nucleotidase [Allocatelliglobosispora scoriae]|uniref:5'-nucleotidase n=1 Tax=Allocatelliglobosispora scoriae TaxID=643052 RepID=A0A841BNX2_9ACTN|nr:5'-nucleotidase [Allocatelliglobosispora scoriae]MBB5868432.1 5'-nucleotidase [Allocatelliglobosispora scoriae]